MPIPTRNKPRIPQPPKIITPTLKMLNVRSQAKDMGKYEPRKMTGPHQEVFELPREENVRRITEMLIRDFFPKNFKYVRRENLQGEQKELHDLRTLFLEAMFRGKITRIEDFKNYLKEFLQENLEISEQEAEKIAQKSYKKFLISLGPRKKVEELTNYIRLMKN